MRKRVGWYAAGLLALAMVARAGIIIYNATLVDTTALAYNNTYTLNLQANGIGSLSAQAVYSSATIANVTFQDGAQSTGSFTVGNYLALSSASANNSITVASTSNLTGATIALPGFVFVNGIDWATQPTATGTALSLASALATVPFLSVSEAGGIVYATATYGSYYNSFALTSNNGNLTVAKPFFTGGQDNAYVAINGVRLQQGSQWTALTSNAATASSLASAINAASLLNNVLSASASGALVTSTSTLNGAKYNYRLQTSTPTALAASGGNMISGNDPAFALGGTLFTTAGGATLTTALPILYSQGSLAIGGLTNQTTYYAVPSNGNSFMLAKYSTSAVAGNADLVVVTSTNTQTISSEHTYTLAALPISGTPGLSWSASNDGINYAPLQVSSVTISSYSPGGASTFWSFGYIGTQFLRLSVAAPTTGGLALKVTLIGTN